ncbi:hypothetical protein TCAL_07254 [Tigriopus californicus]|uniref:Chitin-binding type-4 domain-containing protein n=1 Tax=Tigriopus californicus TaxID=6832 RepID=A0A553NSW9_TIGCA|nr:uncharacterized protein LOC131879690 [Tigriopus californicus]XP_059082059.1 uncharacterized protein LOC131879690 [Tigriopus californicus]TRY68536.1 hypothetical protein TCAL_07254 [Tigriopus californicus]|eukprot:TCALIF_07254-PA protein Name:"Protein of unknown function" AED:0.04 eAED:0.04 QI:103/1/0.8/1/1/1/5/24/350
MIKIWIVSTWLILLISQYLEVSGHCIYWEPPSRASLGKHSNNICGVPENDDHMSLYCGGVDAQHLDHEGKCAICGDEWESEDRPHEVPGKYATGIIGRSYFEPGQVIETIIDVVANHKGYYYFKLCVNNNPEKDPDQSCFDQHPLKFEDGSDIYVIPLDYDKGARIINKVKLPEGITCWQCILQWTWIAGNRWGVGPQTPFHYTEDCLNDEEGKLGCGNQETFRGCSDICIGPGCPRELCQQASPFPPNPSPPDVIPPIEDLDNPDLEEYIPEEAEGPPLQPVTPLPSQPTTSTTATPSATTLAPPMRPCLQTGIKDEFFSDLGDTYCQSICLGHPMYLCNLYICYCNTN